MIEGKVEVAGQVLGPRDGFGLAELEQIPVSASEDAFILAMDVPLRLPTIA